MMPILFPAAGIQKPPLSPGPVPAPLPLPLPEATRAALLEALADHRRALASYSEVLAKLGAVEPFLTIAEAERHHLEALLALFRLHGLDIPPSSQPSPAQVLPSTAHAASLPEACAAGVKSEEATIAMYDRLLAQVRRSDVRAVFRRLQAAARGHHLPAFQACANP